MGGTVNNYVWNSATGTWIPQEPISSSITITADTEFSTAAALADNTANPTTTLVGACLEVWDGATWDRAPGNATDGVKINLGVDNDVKTALTSVTPTSSTLSVGTSSAQLVASNVNRKTIIVTNTHASQRVTLNFGSTAVIDTGITIMAGGAYSMGELDYYSGVINVIASGASTVLSIAEF